MYKILKIVLIGCICFYSAAVSAQYDEYIAAENNRILLSQKTELEIKTSLRIILIIIDYQMKLLIKLYTICKAKMNLRKPNWRKQKLMPKNTN